MSITRYLSTVELLLAMMLAGLLAIGSPVLFIMAYFAIFVFAAARTIMANSRLSAKAGMLGVYAFALAFQVLICEEVLMSQNSYVSLAGWIMRRFLCILAMALPLIAGRYIYVGKYSRFYLPSLAEIATISFSELKGGSGKIAGAVSDIVKARKRLSPDNIKEIIGDLPRHSSFKYINNGTLTPAYFEEAEMHMCDPYIYIIISDTGSAASELISIFTQKQYNHASLSFDRDLKTIISYNGGERVYPPGLNQEMLEFFNKKQDASIIVYKLSCSKEQKRRILNKVREINAEGSAYNMMGLVLKYSHKPNIMFCSQFVYNMLEYAGLNYFHKKNRNVSPSDLVEKDYHRKLQFDCEIRLNHAEVDNSSHVITGGYSVILRSEK